MNLDEQLPKLWVADKKLKIKFILGIVYRARLFGADKFLGNLAATDKSSDDRGEALLIVAAFLYFAFVGSELRLAFLDLGSFRSAFLQ